MKKIMKEKNHVVPDEVLSKFCSGYFHLAATGNILLL